LQSNKSIFWYKIEFKIFYFIFFSQGYICPPNYNPADFLIGTLSSPPGLEKASKKSINRICDLFAVSETAKQRDLLINFEVHMSEVAVFQIKEEEKRFKKPFWITTFFWLTYRSLLQVCRDPAVQVLRVVQKIVCEKDV
jgi:ATP-binding cassette, subfamily G (WHITE), eye pigment precursor transporter